MQNYDAALVLMVRTVLDVTVLVSPATKVENDSLKTGPSFTDVCCANSNSSPAETYLAYYVNLRLIFQKRFVVVFFL